MSTLKTNNLQLLDSSRNIAVSKIAEMNGGFSFRNKIIDGRFDFWYEGTSQTTNGYGSDTMSLNAHYGSIKTHSRQPLVAGVDLPAIEVSTAKYFSRTIVSSLVNPLYFVVKRFRIEDVSTLAGKTATFSFYGRANASKNISVSVMQNFGTGGSPSAAINGISAQLVQLTTSFSRKQIQLTFPSISGKTLGTNNDSYIELTVVFDAGATAISSNGYASGMVQQSGTFDIACVQLEEGSVATPFEELPMEVSQIRVNRHYETSYSSGITVGTNSSNGVISYVIGHGNYANSGTIVYKVTKRAVPAVSLYSPTGGSGPGYVLDWITGAIRACGTENGGEYGCSPATASGFTTGYIVKLHFTADARL